MGDRSVAAPTERAAGVTASSWLIRVAHTRAPATVILIRIVVGGIFLEEGIQKFLFPAVRGPGRFAAETPLPAPTVFGYLTGGFEIACGLLLMVGLATRLAAVPLIVVMLGAEAFTKIPIAVQDSAWVYIHEARTELCLLFGSVFLLIAGAGAWSADAALIRRRNETEPTSHSSPARE